MALYPMEANIQNVNMSVNLALGTQEAVFVLVQKTPGSGAKVNPVQATAQSKRPQVRGDA